MTLHLRIWNKYDFEKECTKENNLPNLEKAALVGSFDDQIALTPVSFLQRVLFLLLPVGILVVVLLEEQLHEIFVAVTKLEIGSHVVLIEILTQNL